jgi:hypothetical protein
MIVPLTGGAQVPVFSGAPVLTGAAVVAPAPGGATVPSAVITRASLAARPGVRISVMLGGIAGLRLVPIGGSDWGVASARASRPPDARAAALQTLDGPRHSACFVQIRIDGLPMPSYDGSDAFPIDEIRADRVERIEVYLGPATVPASLGRRSSSCGVILVTTRR